jgi:hypothetical protein
MLVPIVEGLAMASVELIGALQRCEEILSEAKRRNNEHEIFADEVLIADRLLARRLELGDAYKELYAKLDPHPHALNCFLDLLVSTAALWSPEKNAEARAERERLEAANVQIADKAAELAGLLEERARLHNNSAFSSSTHYSVAKVIEVAAEENCLFGLYVQKPLRGLRGQFSLKYWPTLAEFVWVLARDAENAKIEATDPLTAAATKATRSSLADFFKALFAAMEENSAEEFGALPRGFRLTDATLASLATCALDLGPDELVDSAYVKRLRQREREGLDSQDHRAGSEI